MAGFTLMVAVIATCPQSDPAAPLALSAAQPTGTSQPTKEEKKPSKPEQSESEQKAPGLKVGDKAPGDAKLIDVEGKSVTLKDLWKEGPVVITFYRGGWCPFCTKALSAWMKRMDDLKAAGGKFVAITPEAPAEVKTTKEKSKLDAVVLVDDKSEAGKGFSVHFELDEATKEKYKGYGIDLAKSNQNGKWELDAPATFVIDTTGVVRYVFADWDYKKRAEPDKVIGAVKELSKKK